MAGGVFQAMFVYHQRAGTQNIIHLDSEPLQTGYSGIFVAETLAAVLEHSHDFNAVWIAIHNAQHGKQWTHGMNQSQKLQRRKIRVSFALEYGE